MNALHKRISIAISALVLICTLPGCGDPLINPSGDSNNSATNGNDRYTNSTGQISAFGGTKKTGSTNSVLPISKDGLLSSISMNADSTSCAQPKKLLSKLWVYSDAVGRDAGRWDGAIENPNVEYISTTQSSLSFKYLIKLEGKDCSFIRIYARNTLPPDGVFSDKYAEFSAGNLSATNSGVFGIAKETKECKRDEWRRGGCRNEAIDILCFGNKCEYTSVDSAFHDRKIKSSDPWPSDVKAKIIALENAVRDVKEKEERERKLQIARAEKERKEYEARNARNEAAYNQVLNATTPRAMYLGAIGYEDKGERSRAKEIYRGILKRFADSQEALLASQRLTRLGDVEAMESSASRAANAAYDAASQTREANYQQCINERSACFSRCSSLKSGRSTCESGCTFCSH